MPDYVTLGERYEAEVYAAVSFSAGIEIDGALPRFVDQRSRLLVRMRSAKAKPGKNDPCPCGSGKKDKRCCGAPL